MLLVNETMLEIYYLKRIINKCLQNQQNISFIGSNHFKDEYHTKHFYEQKELKMVSRSTGNIGELVLLIDKRECQGRNDYVRFSVHFNLCV